MKLTREELIYFVDQSRRAWLELQPSVCLPGTFKALTESDRVAVSWLQAAIDLLARRQSHPEMDGSMIPNVLELEFDLPDFTTPTDGYDAGVEKEDDK